MFQFERALLLRTQWGKTDVMLMARTMSVALLIGLTATLAGCGPKSSVTTLTATVNNGDMVVMKKLGPEFERQNPDIHLKWVVLEENVLRQRVTTDIATKGGQFDIVTIGNYEVPIWAKQGWLIPSTISRRL
jgi:sorbitol/mannitol transport system substrate-binding protein